MFSKIPNEILEIICSYLNIKEERRLAGLFPNVDTVSTENMQRQLTKIIQNPHSATHSQLLLCIVENEKVGFAIIKNEYFKNILLTQKSKSLPHWILGIGECQPNLLAYIMEDKDYRHSLTQAETQYIMSNYKNLLPHSLIAVLDNELTNRAHESFEVDLYEEEEDEITKPTFG